MFNGIRSSKLHVYGRMCAFIQILDISGVPRIRGPTEQIWSAELIIDVWVKPIHANSDLRDTLTVERVL